MALRSSSPSASAGATDHPDSTLEGDGALVPNAAVDPATPEKRRIAWVLVVVLLVGLSLPWWLTNQPAGPAVPWLNGWTLVATGLSISPFDVGTGFNAFGRVMLGLLPTLPTLGLTVALLVRAVRPLAVKARTITIWAVLGLAGIGVLLVMSWLVSDTYNGNNPVLLGALLPTMAAAFSAIVSWNWWRQGERDRYPRRVKQQPAAAGEVSEEAGEAFMQEHAEAAHAGMPVAEVDAELEIDRDASPRDAG